MGVCACAAPRSAVKSCSNLERRMKKICSQDADSDLCTKLKYKHCLNGCNEEITDVTLCDEYAGHAVDCELNQQRYQKAKCADAENRVEWRCTKIEKFFSETGCDYPEEGVIEDDVTINVDDADTPSKPKDATPTDKPQDKPTENKPTENKPNCADRDDCNEAWMDKEYFDHWCPTENVAKACPHKCGLC